MRTTNETTTEQTEALSVVICAYTDRRWHDLNAAVESVTKQDLHAQVVVVIDHHPALFARASETWRDVVVVENSQDRGLSGARNSGIAACTGDIIAFLDDDAVAESGWLRALATAYRDPVVLGVGGAVIPLWSVGRPRWFPPEFDWVVGCTYRGMPDHAASVRNPIGANMSFRSEVFREIGQFRSGVGRVGSNAVGCEETELCIRAQQHWPSQQIRYEPAAAVAHRVSRDRSTWRYFVRRCYAEGQSKALVSSLVGASDGLASERAYTRRVLPLGVAHGVWAAARGDGWGIVRAAAIVTGLLVTAAGYARGRASKSSTAPGTGPDPADFGPIQLIQIELSRPIPAISSQVGERRYARALILARLHSQPIGTVPIALSGSEMAPRQVAAEIQAALGDEIGEHLRHDNIRLSQVLGWEGISSRQPPQCVAQREEALVDAPFATVVIPTRNRTDDLAACLPTVLALDYPRFEVLVIDNGPASDSTRELIERVRTGDERVRYFREHQAGLSRAKNRGLAEARGEIVAFTDDDVLVDSSWLAGLAEAFQLSESVACVTGLIFPRELETASQSWIEQFGGFGKGFSRQVFDLVQHRPPGVLFPYTAGMFGSGANMAFRTKVLRQMGGFDLALGAGSHAMGGEDLAVTYQAIVEGYQIVYEPSAMVHHLHHREYERLRRQVYGYGVGLTAYIAHTVARDPRSLMQLARKLPLGIAYALNPWSGKNKAKADYPRELTLLELRGMLHGPVAYWRSRRSLSKHAS